MTLKQGDRIDIIAPSSFPKDSQWRRGLKILQSWGLKPQLPKESIAPYLWHSNSNRQRSYFLNKAFSNPDSSAIWMIRGGYGMQKLMPSFIKNYSANYKKKLFIGYSDGSALHFYLNGKNHKTLQAPLICELPHLSVKELSFLKDVLFGIKKEIVFNNLKVQSNSPKRILKAPIVGGNLSLLSSSVGTAWLPRFKSHFLFIEDINEEDHKFDRMLCHLFYSGFLKGIKALLFGVFSPLNSPSLQKKLFKSFSDICDIPMVFGLPCGHCAPHYPLPFNAPAELVIQGNKASLKVRWHWTAPQKLDKFS